MTNATFARNIAEECACINARAAARTLTRFYEQCLAPAGLTVSQFAILAALAATKGTTITQMAAIVGLERTGLTRSLHILERQKYIKIEVGKDVRSKNIKLTPPGKARLAKALPLWKKAQAIARKNFNYDAAMQAFRDINEGELAYNGK